MNLRSLFKKSSNGVTPAGKEENLIIETKNWYSDRYESILVQRNILLLFTLVSVFIFVICIYSIGQIASSKSIEPFVIEIEDSSGITNVVNPFTTQALLADNALNSYFLIKYIRARECYNTAEYAFNTSTLVRLFSISEVFYDYKREMEAKNFIAKYGATNSTSLKVRSIQYLTPGVTAQIRFAVVENAGARNVYNKIVTLNFAYSQMQLTVEDRFINPLGFQVTSYVVNDEINQ